jgi:hypothetical protein
MMTWWQGRRVPEEMMVVRRIQGETMVVRTRLVEIWDHPECSLQSPGQTSEAVGQYPGA